MACEELYENCKVSIEHSLSNGLYCEVHADRKLNEKDRENSLLQRNEDETPEKIKKRTKIVLSKMLELNNRC